MRKKAWVYVLILVMGLGTLGFSPNNNYFEIAKNLDIFATLFKEVNTYYVDEVEPEKLMRTGIDAMLTSLDPYTNFIPEEDMDNYRTMTTGEYAGIGSLIGQINGRNIITMPNKGFPADRAGIKIGDEIIAVDGLNVEDKSTSEISKLLKGKAKTQVVLTVRRYGQKENLNFTIIRGRIILNNVAYYGMVNSDVGFIKLTDFTTNAGKEVKKALFELKSLGAQSLIIDLRGNPGGLLHEAVNICNLFIPKGSIVVSTRGKIPDWNKTYKALNNPVDTNIPLVILTNQGSASASEIVAGVIQDYDRGVIVGRKTFGKGLVQISRPLTYNAQLKITTARYYTPSGRCIQALDYSSRNSNGIAAEIPDSLKMEFETSGGRKVFDGGGVTPDITIDSELLSPISISLLQKGLIFNYATEFYYKHKSIAPAVDFVLMDEDYKDFMNWLKDKDYDYLTPVEENMQDLIENAKEEQIYLGIADQIEDLNEQIHHNKELDLITNKNQIKALLEESIASRYYLVHGEINASFDKDQDLQAAIKLLANDSEYKDLLNPSN